MCVRWSWAHTPLTVCWLVFWSGKRQVSYFFPSVRVSSYLRVLQSDADFFISVFSPPLSYLPSFPPLSNLPFLPWHILCHLYFFPSLSAFSFLSCLSFPCVLTPCHPASRFLPRALWVATWAARPTIGWTAAGSLILSLVAWRTCTLSSSKEVSWRA